MREGFLAFRRVKSMPPEPIAAIKTKKTKKILLGGGGGGRDKSRGHDSIRKNGRLYSGIYGMKGSVRC